jgi:hypothetical protein
MIAPRLCLSVVLGLVGQAQPDPAGPESPGARLHIMKKSVARVQMRTADVPGDAYRLQAEPVLRFTNTVGSSRDGAIFLWLGEGDRPGAAVQVFQIRDGTWLQEWTSLATGPLTVKIDDGTEWRPSRGGVAFQPVPDAPKPAETAEQRLRQMQALARDFAVRDHFRGQSWQPLRLLPKPMARYGKPSSEATDGALFAFVLTTDPEAFLLIEARAGNDGPVWQYAFAPMSIYALEASWKNRVVWNLQARSAFDSVGSFYHRNFQPGQ